MYLLNFLSDLNTMENTNDFQSLINDSELPTLIQNDKNKKSSNKNDKSVYREQDIYLPIANVARIMKNSVPQNGKIAKESKECVQECVSEFISFITSEAAEHCSHEKRKTINGEDILYAMATLGFDNYIEPLKLHLHQFREVLKTEKNASSMMFSEANSNTDVDSQLTGLDQLVDISSPTNILHSSQNHLIYHSNQQFEQLDDLNDL